MFTEKVPICVKGSHSLYLRLFVPIHDNISYVK